MPVERSELSPGDTRLNIKDEEGDLLVVSFEQITSGMGQIALRSIREKPLSTNHIKEKRFLERRFSRRLFMTWKIDLNHSRISFAIRVMAVMTTRGRFNKLHGNLHIDERNPASSWVEIEVEAASVDTHNTLRDVHLRSNSFFAVKKYPTLSFRSTRVEHTDGKTYKVTGDLILLGMTKPVTFAVEYSGQRTGLDAQASIVARTTINRGDFGLGWSMMGRFAADKITTVEIALVAVRKSARMG